MIIGVTGTIGAGKDTIAGILKERGFGSYTVRGFLLRILKEKGRDSMRELANELREKHGPGYIVEELYKGARKEGKDAVISSIRAVGEIKALRDKEDFYLFAVDAEPRTRYERVHKRGSTTDGVSYEEFIEQERKEMGNDDPGKQNLSRCIEAADYVFDNNGSIEELKKMVMEVLDEIKSKN